MSRIVFNLVSQNAGFIQQISLSPVNQFTLGPLLRIGLVRRCLHFSAQPAQFAQFESQKLQFVAGSFLIIVVAVQSRGTKR